MPKETTAVIPEYVKTDNFSKMSIMWLHNIASKNNINIQHVLNGGEKHLTINKQTYKVDRFCEKIIVY